MRPSFTLWLSSFVVIASCLVTIALFGRNNSAPNPTLHPTNPTIQTGETSPTSPTTQFPQVTFNYPKEWAFKKVSGDVLIYEIDGQRVGIEITPIIKNDKVSATHAILSQTSKGESGIPYDNLSDLKLVSLGKYQFYYLTQSLFEGVVNESYFLVQPNHVIHFDHHFDAYQEWTDPSFDIAKEPSYQSFRKILSTLSLIPNTSCQPSSTPFTCSASPNIVTY